MQKHKKPPTLSMDGLSSSLIYPPGNPAILLTGPVALRHQVTLILPLQKLDVSETPQSGTPIICLSGVQFENPLHNPHLSVRLMVANSVLITEVRSF